PLPSPCLQVILAALWLGASEAQPPGSRDRAVPQGQRVLVQLPTRPRRQVAKCPSGMNWVHSARQCCVPCPAGMFLHHPCTSRGDDTVCTACPTGTFRTQPNTLAKCQACYECDRQGELAVCCATRCCAMQCHATHCLSFAAFQRVLSNCSATSNVACGCESGHFRKCHNQHCSEFSCQLCQPCTGHLIQRPCSEAQDTICGGCQPDFYAEGSECRPCHTSTPETCGKECQRACGSSSKRASGLEYILLALTGPLFLGALAIYHKRKRLQHDALASSSLPVAHMDIPTPQCQVSAQRWDSPCGIQPCLSPLARQSPEHQTLLREQPGGTARPEGQAEPPEPCAALLQGSQLYAVINAVPVRRWKEFMRVLELREEEIDLVELEVAHIRDQQYEMLKRWCQQTTATLDRIFTALEHMELAGCAEALRRSL
ncbi:TNR25 factor, partial [Brachypteracias leptosomus]|nr:TNR25 factor [Brachypteracias leptosomus]